MNQKSKIYIAGHTGMVGSAITRRLREKGFTNIIGRTMEDLDLTNQQAVAHFFETEKPEYIVLAAAKVGGIMANNIYRAQFIYENLMIETNIVHQAYLHGVKKLLFLGSSCIYPRNAPQPLKEEYLLIGELEQTNEPYAIAKIAGIKLCENYFRQYGCNFISVMPTNLYGPNDNYNLETSHVLPAIIRKMHLSHCLETNNWEGIRKDLDKRPIEGINGAANDKVILSILNKYGINAEFKPVHESTADLKNPLSSLFSLPIVHCSLELWGTGQVFREFMHVDDMADVCVKVLEDLNVEDLINHSPAHLSTFFNIGTGEDQTIAEIAALVKSIVGFTGEIRWDNSKPDGTLKKLLDVSFLKNLNWNPSYSLHDGILSVYNEYVISQKIQV